MDRTGWATHCFGRFLIDLPPGSALKAGNRIWGEPIESLSVAERSLSEQIDARVSELEGTPHEFRESMLVRHTDLARGSASIVSWAQPYSLVAMQSETFLIAGERDAPVFFRYSGLVSPEKLESALAFYEDLARKIRSRRPDEIPTEPGFCIDGGYIAGSEFMAESFRVGITMPGHPGMHMTFRSSTGAEEDTLLERVGGFFRTEVLGRVAGMNTLRKGKRSVGPIAGEEYLVAGGDRQQRMYAFRWEFQGRDGSLAEPNLSLQMGVHERDPDDDGNPPPPAFDSDQEALELWDAVLESIRLRPGAA